MFQRITMILIILVVVLGGGFYAYKELMPKDIEDTQGPIYSTKEVVRGDISVGVEVNGRLEAARSRSNGIRVGGERRYFDWGMVEYKIEEIFVEEGDSVKKDQVIVTLDAASLNSKIKEREEELRTQVEQLANMASVSTDEVYDLNPSKGIVLKAPIDGTIIDIKVEEAKELEIGQVIARIVDDSTFKVKANLTINEYKSLKVGDEVVLKFPNFDSFYTGKVTKMNPNPIPYNEEIGGQTFAQGFVHIVEIEAENPGLVQNEMKVKVGIRNNETSVSFFAHDAEVEGFAKEQKVSNTAKAVVTEIHVDEMQKVKKGDPIVTMASKNIQDTIEERLYKIKQIKEEISELKQGLNNLEVRAPADGIINWLDVQPGETVRPGQYICDLFNVESMELYSQIDDIDVLNVKIDAPVRITFDALPGEVFEGKVVDIRTSSGGNSTGITKYPIRIDIEGNSQLKPGMQAKGYIDAGSAKDVLLVPMEAVFDEEGKTMVEILDENGNVKAVPVKLGLMNTRVAEIKEGLKEGDKVITGSTIDLLPSQRLGDKDSILPSTDKTGDKDKDN
ncbi:efflux RND transporter periplasmic adaptor subunit [Paramaledivibacter caminithermalis]|uniref:RND family efflux transporter, MFP subunit n=1 Tax=Paramaledivibacter caminithermalis (strain DSM 15212 / CIP 107654 / DViRD3) TaxID=1121301 RepID=A0A1M6LH63_PARC5|nr:efflux RND transporter periplasmic adaptor subunit [Paramaledivibacter caminithermalis]SHJ70445.1 RND family efflux transporter, MFP subunit [Paramaledivibacter caminithermalis DSM 15212]